MALMITAAREWAGAKVTARDMEKIQGDSLNNIYKFFNVLSISIFVIVVSVNVNAQFSGTYVNYGMLYETIIPFKRKTEVKS